MKNSDEMGRFAFDGAEGIAFWVADDSDLEGRSIKVMFDELPTLRAFLEYNLPGFISEGSAATKGEGGRA